MNHSIKKLALLAVGIVIAATASAREEVQMSDTLAVIHSPSRVTVVKQDERTLLLVNDSIGGRSFSLEVNRPAESADSASSPWRLNIPFLKDDRKNSPLTITYFRDLYVGMLWGIDMPQSRLSWEIGISHIVGLSYRFKGNGPELSLGVGLSYRQLNFGHGFKLECTAGRLSFAASPEGQKSSSFIREWALRVPFHIFQPISYDFGIGVGVDAVFTTYARAQAKSKQESTEIVETFKGLRQRVFRPELVGMLGWREGLGLYVRYSPVSSFRAVDGPSFSTVSFGLTCNF